MALGKRIAPRVTEEPVLNLICPHCDADVPYGQLRCPGCGAKVDDKFTLVRSTKDGRKATPVEEVETHRIKQFSIFLTIFTMDYDDPDNFLTVHRVRFLGGEMTSITERWWYVWGGLAGLVWTYLLLGIPLWLNLSAAETLSGATYIWAVLFLVTNLPLTLFYLYIVFPDFLGQTIDHPVRGD